MSDLIILGKDDEWIAFEPGMKGVYVEGSSREEVISKAEEYLK